jgi:hypothetical protein
MTATQSATQCASAASAQAKIPTLQATAAMLLPGMKHARSLLDVSIRVLEYFQHHAANDCAAGKFTAPQKAAPDLVEEAEKIKALLSAFGRLNDPNH